jgi:UDP-N-acetylglucosamine diphosphorylase/glucosamine-1-phosphate N-acetyltransferase
MDQQKSKIESCIILVDGEMWQQLLPLTFTRPVGGIRIGLCTIREKWADITTGQVTYYTQPYLQTKFPMTSGHKNIFVHAGLLPDADTIKAITNLNDRESLYQGKKWLASRIDGLTPNEFHIDILFSGCAKVMCTEEIKPVLIERPWQILSCLKMEILNDFQRKTEGKTSLVLSDTNRVVGTHPVFVEEGVTAEFAIFNTKDGPVFLGKNSEVMEGSMIRGPFMLGEGSTVNMGSKIYGPVSVGPKCKVGGEIKGTQFFGNANKGHDGFVGDSIIGEWCNLGADTNTSNLKNNYLPVRSWSYVEEKFVDTGLQFCGLIMGDHTKTGINTMLNTGTVTGAYSNIFAEGYPRTFIPSFAWGGASGFSTHPMKKAMETAEIVLARRQESLTSEDRSIAQAIFDFDAKYRVWEKGSH